MIEPTRTASAHLLTPPGTGAISVIRVSGPEAASIVDRLFESPSKAAISSTVPNKLRFGKLADQGEILDDVIATVGDGPLPSVDIFCHGGVRVTERIMIALQRLGAKLPPRCSQACSTLFATSTRIERETIDALGRAQTSRAVRFLALQRTHLPEELAKIAELCKRNPKQAADLIAKLRARFRPARFLIDGATVSIVGPPNSGKSTLMNRLVGKKTAVVSDEAGTTRDWVTQSIELKGIPLTLVDTAGVRKTASPLERRAIEAGKAAADKTNLKICLVDSTSKPDVNSLDEHLLANNSQATLIAVNKLDAPPTWNHKDLLSSTNVPVVGVSALIGTGIEDLSEHILQALGQDLLAGDPPSIFTDRQDKFLKEAALDLDRDANKSHNMLLSESFGG